jgi:multicomponent K+:H+ antiporter subunit A
VTLALIALLPWLGALALAALPANARRTAAALAGAVALAVTGAVLALAAPVFAGDVPRWSVPWLPALDLRLGFRLDGLAWLFALGIGGIGALVVLYAAWYLDADEPGPRFFAFLLMFMGAMLGVVLADNLLLLVVYWELTSLASFLLIGWWYRDGEAREGARMALAITGAGGLALLAGVLLLGHIVGTFDLDTVLRSGDGIRAHPLYETALVLVLLGAFTKSAQFPFHFWLPHAMAAPTPVSAYLHSATMVKAGVFLLARLYPALGSSEPWFWIVSAVGLTTLVIGAYIAIFKHDLKGLLAYSTISHLGLITLLLGLDEPLAVVAGVFHVINHATFKAGLFMSAGIIDHECGTRDMRRINGLARVMPFTATLGIVAAAAMAGVPLLNGFLSKEMFFAETLSKQTHEAMQWLLPAGALLAGVFAVAYSLRFVHDVFFNGEPKALPRTPHEPPFFMRLPLLLLVLLCLAMGLLPGVAVGPTLAVAAKAALHGPLGWPLPEYTLAVWHGFNPPLAMSAAAVAAGVALYFGLQRFVNLHRLVHLPFGFQVGGREVFAALLDGTLAGARALTRALQSGHLQRYVLWLLVLALAAGAWPFFAAAPAAGGALPPLPGVDAASALIAAIGIAAVGAAVRLHRQRLAALLGVGAVGLVVCLVFAQLSAPDLALTQLLVEVVTVVLVLLALKALPETSPPERGRLLRAAHATVALAAGAGAAAIVWLVLSGPFDSISPFFLERSVPEGGGANVVNVILVDFRGFDTLGEITVLGIAALAMHALLGALWAPAPPPAPRSPMLPLVAGVVLPFAALLSVHLFLRGHNLPGGGFIASLVLAIGLVLQFIANGAAAPGRGDYRNAIAAGLAVAIATGAAAWVFDAPFLTSTYDYPVAPLIGALPLASASLFDLGVYLVVLGATMVMLVAVMRLRAAAPPAAAPEA